MRRLLLALSMLVPLSTVHAQVGVEVGLPGVSIGINLPIYPELVLVPGSPVYYSPRGQANYFFYDGLYWVYRNDNWYSSEWYNGPWDFVGPEYVPLFVLRVPVRYYRQPPAYFRHWRADAPPRWGDHWGREWEDRRAGWNQWDRHEIPQAAPLPVYQRKFSGNRYPGATERQHVIRAQNYRYQPRETISQEHFKQPGSPARPHDEGRQQSPARPPAAQETRQAPGHSPRDMPGPQVEQKAPGMPTANPEPRPAQPETRQAPARAPHDMPSPQVEQKPLDKPAAHPESRPVQPIQPQAHPETRQAPAHSPRDMPSPQAEQKPAREPAARAEPRREAPVAPRAAPPDQSRQRPPPEPAAQHPAGGAPNGNRDRAPEPPDNNRNDERGQDRRH